MVNGELGEKFIGKIQFQFQKVESHPALGIIMSYVCNL